MMYDKSTLCATSVAFLTDRHLENDVQSKIVFTMRDGGKKKSLCNCLHNPAQFELGKKGFQIPPKKGPKSLLIYIQVLEALYSSHQTYFFLYGLFYNVILTNEGIIIALIVLVHWTLK